MKNIAIIAHDRMKDQMVQFLKERTEWIKGAHLLATGRTAEFVESKGIEVKHLSPGQSGGYNQITEMIKNKEIAIVIFFRDPEVSEPHHDDIQALLRECNRNNIPLATNYASAELLILGQITKESVERIQKRSQFND